MDMNPDEKKLCGSGSCLPQVVGGWKPQSPEFIQAVGTIPILGLKWNRSERGRCLRGLACSSVTFSALKCLRYLPT
jgi:hypothetical protein